MTVTITRLYNSHSEANSVLDALRAANVPERSISVLASNADEWHRDKTSASYPDKDLDGKDDRGEAAAAGAGAGAVVGGALGALTGLGIMAIPGVGPLVAAGWLVTTLAGAAAGGATGGVLGALTQAGASPEEAEVYAEGLRRGGAVVSVRADDAERSRIEAIMDRSSVNVTERGALYRKAGWSRFDPAAPPYTADQVRRERDLYR
jgi:hypothetical protein